MSKAQLTTTSLGKYYRWFLRQLRQELRKAAWEAVIAIIAIIVVIFFQFYFGWIKRGETLISALVNIAPSTAILVAYAFRHLIRTPWLLDVDRQRQINEGVASIKELQARLDGLIPELTRPKFSISEVVVDFYGEFDEDDRYKFLFAVENTGTRAAEEMFWRVVTVDDKFEDEPDCEDSSKANEIPSNRPFTLQFGFRVPLHQKAKIVVLGFRYKDVITKAVYTQLFFYKSERPRLMASSLPEARHLTMEERETAQLQLEEQLRDFI